MAVLLSSSPASPEPQSSWEVNPSAGTFLRGRGEAELSWGWFALSEQHWQLLG